jgi:succinate-semialdehyde dehydrogenase/glutarate-semialdehyde dehydrogenase
MPIATVNPTTGEQLKAFEALPPDQIDRRLAAAVSGFAALGRTTFGQRAGWMVAAAGILDAEVDSIATMMTTVMGKTLASAKAEVTKCAKACRYYAEHAQQFLAAEPADAAAVGANQAYAIYRPLGPVLAIMPWNFPLWQAMRFAAPALMAGNAGLLKHASNVPQTALFMEELFRRAGFPDGSFQTLLIGADAVEGVLSDRRVKAATLTGSEAAGRSGDRRPRTQEDGAGAGRERPVRGHALGRHRRRGEGGHDGPLPEQRSVVHRGEAVHRSLRCVRPVHRRLRRAHDAAAGR